MNNIAKQLPDTDIYCGPGAFRRILWLFSLCMLMGISFQRAIAQKSRDTILKVAATQFPVSGDIVGNAKYIKQFIRDAAAKGADIIQFPEAALSGYPPADMPSFVNYNWDLLRAETTEIMSLAKEVGIWVVLGSAHYLSEKEKPLNCVYLISNEGKIVDRYDKSMLTGGDLNHFTAGNHTVVAEIKGFKLGFLICYDSCFPEMYNIYRHKDVTIMFHSFYNARHKTKSILDEIIPAEIRVRASDNLMWVIASNSSADYSSWPTCIARPDGSLESLGRGIPGILYREFPDRQLTGNFASWTHNNKKMAMPAVEVYHNGTPSKHPRAVNTRSLP
ncbi:MAG TPA: carbon-nitrogen hydrolase family protein [Flavitalea sp.]|nr:carbon-nitrogen hydrolase family protein [Flavitalea sp.]